MDCKICLHCALQSLRLGLMVHSITPCLSRNKRGANSLYNWGWSAVDFVFYGSGLCVLSKMCFGAKRPDCGLKITSHIIAEFPIDGALTSETQINAFLVLLISNDCLWRLHTAYHRCHSEAYEKLIKSCSVLIVSETYIILNIHEQQTTRKIA